MAILELRAAKNHVIELARAGKGNFRHARGKLVQIAWFFVAACVIDNRLMPFSAVRVTLLRLFGARIGKGCRCPHPIKVKYPWNLEVGDSCWFGEDVYLYNQGRIQIGSNVCISQGAFLTTGSHEVGTTMDLRIDPITIEDGVWISSRCVVQKGVTVGRSAVVTPLSVVHKSLDAEGIYGGNPCKFLKKRFQ